MTQGNTSFNTYLNRIGKYPLLTPEQEIDLGRKVQRAQQLKELERELTTDERRAVRVGERAARKFVDCNLRLVISVAKKYVKTARCMDLMDLVQEGNIGLMTAVNRFDPGRGYRFSTYAYWWIRQAITRSIQYKDRAIRLPGRVCAMAYTWSSKIGELTTALGRAPTKEEMAEAFRVEVAELELFLERGGHAGSLDAVMHGGEGSTLLDLMFDSETPENQLERMANDELHCALDSALMCLDPRDRQILEKRWGLSGSDTHTLREIGTEMGISRQRVQQLIELTHNRIRLHIGRRVSAAREARERSFAGTL